MPNSPIKEVFVPHLKHSVKFGRRRADPRMPSLQFKRYIGALPAPPTACDYRTKAAPVLSNVYLNDQLGDCVIAAGYHVVGVETGNAGTLFRATSNQILADYSAIGGYVPGNPDTDQGCDEQTALNYWTQHGFANGTKLAGWLALDPTNKVHIAAAMYLFENLLFGIYLPDKWISPFPAASGFTWDVGAPDYSNGHAIMGVGYTAAGVQVDTWGMIGTLTWAAIAKLCTAAEGGDLYVLLTPDQIAKGQAKAPNGFDWASLIADFNALGGNVPAPTPTPTPTPAPTSVTLSQAIAWATKGLTDNWPK